MRDGGRIDASIRVLHDVLDQRTPVKDAVRDWGKRARYAGARDRAWVSGLVLDALRRRNSLAYGMGSESARSLALGALRWAWDWDVKRIELALTDDHAPPQLSEIERSALILAPDPSAPDHVRGDFPEWLKGRMVRTFGGDAVAEAQAMTARAPVDIRANSLKSDVEKTARALESIHADRIPELSLGFRARARDAADRAENIEAIPAYSKGWVEVQDMGSQIAAALSCAAAGEQVLDYCAGGGGKTLAMSAMMGNAGQIYAHDVDGKRLSALIPRLTRAGVRNVQLRHPRENASLDDLSHRMDLVMIDAPCTGVGTWRRRPDAKWRLSEAALSKRLQEQAEILRIACNYVKPGGRLLYVTCSFLMDENEDQVRRFLQDRRDFVQEKAADWGGRSPHLTSHGHSLLRRRTVEGGAIRLTPRSAGCDGFYIAALRRTHEAHR